MHPRADGCFWNVSELNNDYSNSEVIQYEVSSALLEFTY